SPKKDDGLNEQSRNSRIRFDKLKQTYDNAQGAMNAESIRDALNSVHASQYSTSGEELTAWSAVFEPNSKKITYYFRENYDKPIVVEF
ncbi:MAG: hypothetical protein IKQ84_03290, partial [Spirochaetaceae bacterium]|nr:hypothetical protein [Spirochaetaceae bacterium]